ncbi:MAG TPA: 2'-5' RNA ligase family protein [archaeon]|jgi:2'-5' RNA ligase|nr:2'-5' RNA ligase family protein [archaeon]HRT03391.1 2'-5' RNA ligase family protein [Candidatus Diapherotrites archaeon]
MPPKEIYICVVPDLETNKILKELQEEIKKETQLKQNDFPLHISLKSPFFIENPKDLDQLIKDLQESLKEYKPFESKLNNFDIFSNRVLVLKTEKNKDLEKLERKVVKIVKKYDLRKNKYLQNLNKLNEKQKKYLEKYGDYKIFEYFVPHLTLIFNIQNKKQKIMGILQNTEINMKIIVNKIIIVDRKTKQFIKEIKFGSGD